ncbi:MAG: preprotein translocase subunit SecE [Planctomycetia bacterium]|nr:preprotein translocase subunit SecE [Planctomycetia bacterium]
MAEATKNVEVKYYKPGQGTWARWVAGVLLMLLVLFGAHSLYNFIGMNKYENGINVGRTFWGYQLAKTLPGIKEGLTVGLITSTLVFFGGCFLVYLFIVNHKRLAEFLIDTEAEMHRVSWPQKHEFVGSSIVVFVSIAIIGGFVTVVDVLLRMLFFKSGLMGG